MSVAIHNPSLRLYYYNSMILGLQLEYSKLLLAEKILKVSAFMPLSSFCPATNWESGLKLNSATSLQLCCSTFALGLQQTHTHSVTGNVRDPRARQNIHCPQITPVLLLCQCVSGTFFKKQANFNLTNCWTAIFFWPASGKAKTSLKVNNHEFNESLFSLKLSSILRSILQIWSVS